MKKENVFYESKPFIKDFIDHPIKVVQSFTKDGFTNCSECIANSFCLYTGCFLPHGYIFVEYKDSQPCL